MKELNAAVPVIPVDDLGTNASAWDAAALPALAKAIAEDTAATFTDPFITGGVPALELSEGVPAEDQEKIKAHSEALGDWLESVASAAVNTLAAAPGYLTHWFAAAIEAGRAEVRRTGLNDTGEVPMLSFEAANAIRLAVTIDGTVHVEMDGVARFLVTKANVVQVVAGDDTTILYDNRRRVALSPMSVEASNAEGEIKRLADWLLANAPTSIEGSAVDTAIKLLETTFAPKPEAVKAN